MVNYFQKSEKDFPFTERSWIGVQLPIPSVVSGLFDNRDAVVPEKRSAKYGYLPRTCTSEVYQLDMFIPLCAMSISSGSGVSG